MSLKEKKIVILAEQLYEDLELWYPALRFREEGAEVTIAGGGKDSYDSKHGYPVKTDTTADKVKAGDIDALIIPGGYAPDHMRRHESMVKLVRDAAEAGKVVAAICHGGWMLASAEVIESKKLTCFHAIKDDLRHAGAEYVDEEVVRDGNIITSRTPSDLPAFCREIIAALKE